ncbi:AP-4 complex subunit beta-1-like [Saccoglossus kowalevskii]|uniref:AP complex subunit beta n=1 Tax=Saccoglossus kowalevskii TaxID=10224 RepID=A0ABM0M585_SACKO|nr:PREDICTED: AP-4 complex subunit beta-1-like [Saccoglossus kowalevskii]
MASYFATENNSDIQTLKMKLSSPSVQSDPTQCRLLLQRIIALMTQGFDMSELFTHIIKTAATSDIVQKKLVYLYMSTYAELKSDLALLAVNTLRKDCSDPNPMIRGLALRTMTSIRLPMLVEYTEQCLLTGLEDSSAYVRRVAVIGCLKIWNIAPNIITGHNVVDKLYNMLRDSDTIVVTNCLSVLDEILQPDGGIVINKNIAHYLLNRLSEFTEWGRSKILDLLLKYEPTQDEAFDIMNLIDGCLKHRNSAVSSSAIKLLLHLTKDMEDIHLQVFKQVTGPLLNLVTSSNSELAYTSLCHAQLLVKKAPDLFNTAYKKFFCRYNDPSYLKHKKIELLSLVCCEDNVQNIVNELSAYCTDVSVSLAEKSITALGDIVKYKPLCSQLCMKTLIHLLSLQLGYITSQVLITLQGLFLYERNACFISDVMEQIPECVSILDNSNGKAAMIWLIGHYGQSLSDSPYILEDMIDNISEEHSNLVKLHLITATTKLFFKRPAECQDMLGKLLEHCIEVENNVEVGDRASMYYRLLHEDINKAKEIINSSLCTVKEDDEKPCNTLHHIQCFGSLSVLFGQAKWKEIKLRERQQFTEKVQENETLVCREKEINTANLLSIDDGDCVAMETIKMKNSFTLTPEAFEGKWIANSASEILEFTVPSTLTAIEVEQRFNNHNVVTMATSQYETDPWKAFFYAQDTSEYLYLFELTLSKHDCKAVISLKWEGEEATTSPTEEFQKLCCIILNS